MALGTVSADILDEIVKRIVAVADPEKILLFGSATCGKMGPNSDVDLIIIIKAGVHRRKLAQRLYKELIVVGQAVDLVVATPSDLLRYGDSVGLVYRPALQEGRVIYERTT